MESISALIKIEDSTAENKESIIQQVCHLEMNRQKVC